ncbi:MAG: hypothetical protein Q9174_004063 [Haloplaca sp. 1 TL-2023]
MEEGSGDIEAEIKKEVQGIQGSKQQGLFVPVKLDIACVLFFKTRKPVEPVSFVQRICQEAMDLTTPRRTKFVKRLTPMTCMGKTSEKSLDDTAKAVLGPVFHDEGTPVHKFAIRTSIRNNHAMKRDDIIKRVADIVGERHTVDLKNYDKLILVEVYRVRVHSPSLYRNYVRCMTTTEHIIQNILGLSVVGNEFEKLKKYNLAEIYEASMPKPDETPMEN